MVIIGHNCIGFERYYVRSRCVGSYPNFFLRLKEAIATLYPI
jgi:hypothetical protein